MGGLQLHTSRLRLRPLCPGDAAFVVRLLNDPDFLLHIGDRGVRSEDDARRYIAEGPMASHARHGFGLDCVEMLSGEPAGICGLLRRPALEDADVGYALLPEFRGRGLAAEAVDAVLRDARVRLGLRRVAAVVADGNVRSVRLLEKAGFEPCGRVRLTEQAPEIALYLREL